MVRANSNNKSVAALLSVAVADLNQGRVRHAVSLLQRAHRAAPNDGYVLLTLANAWQRAGDDERERAAIEAALALDAYFWPALLARAVWLEKRGQTGAAVENYRNALLIAPVDAATQGPFVNSLAHARQIVDRFAAAFEAHLQQRLGLQAAAADATAGGRWREALALRAGRSPPFHSQSNQLTIPRLPAQPFFDRSQFPWSDSLERQTDAIRQEMQLLLALQSADFVPYVQYRPGEPVNQWCELNHSPRWSSYHLWRGGLAIEKHLARCPITSAALRDIDAVQIEGLCPNAMFSALAPHTRIPPHHGETNARLVAHLPLQVPTGCRFRVGYDQREWQVGQLLIFDDTIEHEAYNDSDELRVVLIFDVWNPLLAPAERELVKRIAAESRTFAFTC